MAYKLTADDIRALRQKARQLGMPPEELLATIGMETGGSYSPGQWGGKDGKYMGLIQFGGPEREQFGVRPDQSFAEQLGPVGDYLTKRGFKPGMGLDQMYSTINAGSPGRMGASDRPGATVASHVADIQKDWVPLARDILAQYPEGARPTERTYDPLSSMGTPSGNPFKAIASPMAYDPLSSVRTPGGAGYKPPASGGPSTPGGKGSKMMMALAGMGGGGGGQEQAPGQMQTPSVGNPLTRDPSLLPKQAPAGIGGILDPQDPQVAAIMRLLGVG